MKLLSWILVIAICFGQLFKLSPNGRAGATILDVVSLGMIAYGLIQIKFRLVRPTLTIKTALGFLCIGLIPIIVNVLNLSLNESLISIFYPTRFFIFVLLAWIIQSGGLKEIRTNFADIIVLSGFALAVMGLMQLAFFPNLLFLLPDGWDPHYFRTVSTLLDPNFLGGYLVIALLVALNMKRLNIFVIGMIYLAFITTFSRSAAINMAVSFTVFALLIKSKKFFLLTLLFCVGFFLSFRLYGFLISAPHNIDRAQSAKYRIGSWQQGLKVFQSYPIFGVGFNSYQFAIRDMKLADEQFTQSRGATTNDSSLLYVAATTGLVGLGIYWYFLYSLFETSFNLNKIYFAALVGLLAQSFFSNTLFYPFFLLWIFLGW